MIGAGAGEQTRQDYQGCRYAELPAACRACALSADAYHVAAGFLLKTGDPGLAHVATDRSMTAALASQDP